MKLVTYEAAKTLRLGVVHGDFVVDVAAAYGLIAEGQSSDRRLGAASQVLRKLGRPPKDMLELLGLGEKYRHALRVITDWAAGMGKTGAKGLMTALSKVRLRAPIAHPYKIICLGRNYAEHAREQGLEPPAAPVFFLKSHNTICGPGDPIKLPPNSAKVDYEAELAVVMGKRGHRIPESEARKYIAGYTLLNDVSARDFQYSDTQWYRGKSCDTFAPTGPWIVTADEIPSVDNLRISSTLNGAMMQDSNTGNMIFKVPFLISYLSQSITLEVGDLISTGTPPGVGVHRKPPVFLKPGDVVSVTVEAIGTLTNPVAGP